MEAQELETIFLVVGVLVAMIVLPATVIALHQRKRRSFERAAGRRRKEKIRL
jgi:hypothetical protein